MKISELPLLAAGQDEAAFRALVHDHNQTARDHPLDRTVAQLFADQAGRRPDAVAVIDGDRRHTYRDLDLLSNRIARLLAQQDVVPGRYVGVLLDRGWHLVAALLGILKAGAVYVPLNPAFP